TVPEDAVPGAGESGDGVPDGPAGAAPDGGPSGDPGPAPGVPAKVALVLTPVASAPALAGLCAMSGIDVAVVPTGSGAVAVLEVPAKAPGGDWDISELLGDGGAAALPSEAEELAATLSRLARSGVVLLVADLATDVGIESGLSGHISARRYTGGEADEDVSAGLILAGADQVVEDLILGRTRAAQVKGHLRSGELPRWKAARMFARGLRKRKS
ncbi:MAG: hypothetical protein ACYC1Z_13945, partial [Georgenia sp.]